MREGKLRSAGLCSAYLAPVAAPVSGDRGSRPRSQNRERGGGAGGGRAGERLGAVGHPDLERCLEETCEGGTRVGGKVAGQKDSEGRRCKVRGSGRGRNGPPVLPLVSFVTPLETNIIDLWVSPFESRGLEKPCMLLPLSSGGSGRSRGATAGVVKIYISKPCLLSSTFALIQTLSHLSLLRGGSERTRSSWTCGRELPAWSLGR